MAEELREDPTETEQLPTLDETEPRKVTSDYAGLATLQSIREILGFADFLHQSDIVKALRPAPPIRSTEAVVSAPLAPIFIQAIAEVGGERHGGRRSHGHEGATNQKLRQMFRVAGAASATFCENRATRWRYRQFSSRPS